MNNRISEAEQKQIEEAQARVAEVQFGIREIEDRLDDLQATMLGHRLINLAGQAAVDAGKCEGLGLFESFELTQEREKVDMDARSLLRAWAAARSPKQLENALEFFDLKSITGLKASRRLIDYYEEVLGAFEFNMPLTPRAD